VKSPDPIHPDLHRTATSQSLSDPCQTCGGTGADSRWVPPESDPDPCPSCDGSGQVMIVCDSCGNERLQRAYETQDGRWVCKYCSGGEKVQGSRSVRDEA